MTTKRNALITVRGQIASVLDGKEMTGPEIYDALRDKGLWCSKPTINAALNLLDSKVPVGEPIFQTATVSRVYVRTYTDGTSEEIVRRVTVYRIATKEKPLKVATGMLGVVTKAETHVRKKIVAAERANREGVVDGNYSDAIAVARAYVEAGAGIKAVANAEQKATKAQEEALSADARAKALDAENAELKARLAALEALSKVSE